MLSDDALRTLFIDARTHRAWLPGPVDDALLRRLYELARLGPTSTNSQPMRVVFVKSPEAKARLKPALTPDNVNKTMAAPVTAIVAYDREFHELLPKLVPTRDAKSEIAAMPEAARDAMAATSGTLQGGYLIMAARALGLDCGPMGGFDHDKVDATFFPDGRWRSIFLMNIGHGDPAKLRPRAPRLDFDEACRIE